MALGDDTTHINIRDGNIPSVPPDIKHSDFRISDVNEMSEFWQDIPVPTT
jgi:hypothetical protein